MITSNNKIIIIIKNTIPIKHLIILVSEIEQNYDYQIIIIALSV